MNPRFLRQKGSGYIYPWAPGIAEREDMEPYEPLPKEEAPKPQTPAQNLAVTPDLPPLDDSIETFKEEVKRVRSPRQVKHEG